MDIQNITIHGQTIYASDCVDLRALWEDGKRRPWGLRTYEILPFFGLRESAPIPKNYAATRWIGDTYVRISPQGQGPVGGRRVTAMCRHCGKHVCAGHLHQHLKVHKEGK